jgi:hypothetical protein
VKSASSHRRVARASAAGHGPESIGKDVLDVCRPFQRFVVQADDLAILRQLKIELDEDGALIRRQSKRRHRILRRIG